MYIPQFIPKKEKFNTVRKYNQDTIFDVVLMYIKYGVSNRDIDNILLNLESPGYESVNILEYFGITEKHRELFREYDNSSIITLLSKSDEPNLELIELIVSINREPIDYKELLSDSNIVNSKINDIEAYLNAEMRIRNRTIQNKLRTDLFNEFGCKCCLCEVSLPDLLVASHIIPYSQCNNDMNLISNSNNAILLCSIHDKLFESSNHISFDNGRILIGNEIEKQLFGEYKLSRNLFINDKFLNSERNDFLTVHLTIFKQKHADWY